VHDRERELIRLAEEYFREADRCDNRSAVHTLRSLALDCLDRAGSELIGKRAAPPATH
jgi:hypothetical protein